STGIFHLLQGLMHLRLLLIEQGGNGLIEQCPIIDRLAIFGFRSETGEGSACGGVATVDYLPAPIIKLALGIEGGRCAGQRGDLCRRAMTTDENPTKDEQRQERCRGDEERGFRAPRFTFAAKHAL